MEKNNITFFAKKSLALILSGTIVLSTGCGKKVDPYHANNRIPSESMRRSSFEDCYEVNYTENGVKECYNSQYIRLFYDPETDEKKIYFVYEGNDISGYDVYTWPEEELLMSYYLWDLREYYFDSDHFQWLRKNSISLGDDDDDIETMRKYYRDYEYQEYYTAEEMKNLLDIYAHAKKEIYDYQQNRSQEKQKQL